jgi:hypothetical protein
MGKTSAVEATDEAAMKDYPPIGCWVMRRSSDSFDCGGIKHTLRRLVVSWEPSRAHCTSWAVWYRVVRLYRRSTPLLILMACWHLRRDRLLGNPVKYLTNGVSKIFHSAPGDRQRGNE